MKLARFILAALLFATPSWGAVAVEGTPTSAESGATTAGSLDVSHTVPGSLSNSVLYACFAYAHGTDQTPTAAWNTSETMTQISSEHSTGSTNGCSVHTYRLLNPTATTANVSFAGMDTNQRLVGAAITFSGVDQTTPFDAPADANSGSGGTEGPATVDVSSATGDLVVDCACKRNTTEALTVDVSQTQRTNDETTNTTAASNVISGTSTEAGATTVTMSWSWTTATQRWSISGVSINPAAAGGAAPPRKVYVIQ